MRVRVSLDVAPLYITVPDGLEQGSAAFLDFIEDQVTHADLNRLDVEDWSYRVITARNPKEPPQE